MQDAILHLRYGESKSSLGGQRQDAIPNGAGILAVVCRWRTLYVKKAKRIELSILLIYANKMGRDFLRALDANGQKWTLAFD